MEVLDTTVVNVSLPVPTKPIPYFFSASFNEHAGAELQPLSQAILLELFPPENRGQAVAFRALGQSQERQSGHGTLKFGRRRSKLRLYRGRLINVQTLLATPPLWRISPWLLPDP